MKQLYRHATEEERTKGIYWVHNINKTLHGRDGRLIQPGSSTDSYQPEDNKAGCETCEACGEEDRDLSVMDGNTICESCQNNDPIGKETGEWAHKQWRTA